MNIEKTAVFIGHRRVEKDLRPQIKELAEKLISEGVDTFLNGGMGQFDIQCCSAINQLKQLYPHIRHFLVIPYLNFNRCNSELFDEIIYSDLERFSYKAAIPERNKWMVNNSSYAICYVNCSFGGAAATYNKAQEKMLKTFNIWKNM